MRAIDATQRLGELVRIGAGDARASNAPPIKPDLDEILGRLSDAISVVATAANALLGAEEREGSTRGAVMRARKRSRRRQQLKPDVIAESVGDRLQKQREEVFRAMGVVECCKYVSDSLLESTSGRPDIAAALEAAYESLDCVAAALGVVVEEDRERRERAGADG